MSEERNIIKLRGLPWNTTSSEILDFLKDCEVVEGEKGVHLAISHRDGRPNGEAFVELATPAAVDKAFEYNKNVLGHRYIEIFNAKPEEFEQCVKRSCAVQQDTFIKLRGLPFSCKNDDIEQFFQGLEIRNPNGISIVYDNRGRPTGEAFVQFCNSEDTDLAMKRNREKIGSRYIEIFRSSSSECRRSTIFNNNNGGGGGRNGGGGGGGGGGMAFNNDRMGRMGPRNNRTNFRDRPYPEAPWTSNNNSNNDAPWRNNNRGGNSNFGGNNNFSDNFDGGNMFNSDNNFSSDFERNWNSGGNSFNSFGGGGGGGNNSNNSGNNSKSNLPAFDRDSFGFNNFNNNSNSSGGNGNSNFGNDRFMNNGGGGGNNMNNSGGGSQYAVHLRGMPYDCGESEVIEFFAPLKVVNCQIFYNNNGRHTGEADAFFDSVSEAQEAMKKHKERMGNRYIELFAKSNERRGGGVSGGGNGGGGRF